MAIYAGETVQIKVTGKDFDASTPLAESDIVAIYVTIYDSTNTAVLPQTSMSWDDDEDGWVYLWNTTNLPFGSYKAKVEAYGQAATPQSYSLEFARIRLARRIAGA